MGHTKITRIVDAKRVSAGMPTSKIVNLAVSDWHEDPDDDRGSVNVWGNHTTLPSSEDAAWDYVDARYALPISRDEAVITPIPRDSDIKHTTKAVTLKVDGATAERLRSTYSHDERAALAKRVQKETGNRVVPLKVTKFPARRKAKAVATDGKTVTVYDVIGNQPNWNREQVLAKGIDTFPNAKAKAQELADDAKMDDYDSFFVRARIQRVREDGTTDQNMAVVTRPVADEVTITVEVKFEAVKAGWKVDRYQVVFDIHH